VEINKLPERFMPLTKTKLSIDRWFDTDAQFQHLYPSSVQSLALRHWTPLYIAQKVAAFLAAEDNSRILDIGSGVGKFCLGAAYFKPRSFYFGVEQRKDLIAHAEIAKGILDMRHVSFIHGNFTHLDLRNYDHFYFYNSFYENLDGSDKIDNSIPYSGSLYNYYSSSLYKHLERTVAGTKLATFHSLENEVPPCFQLLSEGENNSLKFWVKRQR
jgi:SAM-dependent methyltransferase